MKKDEISVDLSIGPDPLPKVGDVVNHVHLGNQIVQSKVATVIEKSDGRAITIDGVNGPNKKPLRVVYRPKAAMAPGTWHWGGKVAAMLLLLACLAIAFAMPAGATLPTYYTAGTNGSGTTPATLILPAQANGQIRIVTLLYSSDTNLAQFSFSSGGTAYSEIWTNYATSATTNLIDSTNGLTGGSVLVLQHLGWDYTNDVVSWGNIDTNLNGSSLTNVAFVVTASGGFSVLPTIGDDLWQMTAPLSWYVGKGTNCVSGDDIFSGNFGCPVQVTLSPCNAANALNAVSAHYDSASQY